MNIDDEAAKVVTVTHIEYDGYYILIDGFAHVTMPRFDHESQVELLASYLRLSFSAFARRCVEAEREACAKVIPANWLDNLLTGPNAVIGNPPYNCPDIERLLRAIAQAIRQREGK